MTTTAAERIAMRTATEAAAWIEQRRTSRSVVYALGQPILPLSQELWTNRPDVRRFGMAAVSAACADKVGCCRWGLAKVYAVGHREMPPRLSPLLRAFLGAPCSACLRHEQVMATRRVDALKRLSAERKAAREAERRQAAKALRTRHRDCLTCSAAEVAERMLAAHASDPAPLRVLTASAARPHEYKPGRVISITRNRDSWHLRFEKP